MNDFSENKVEFPDFFKHEYGLSYADEIATLNYGYALLAIAGADGKVTPPEMNWLINHQRSLNVPEEIIEAYKTFDYKNAKLEDLIIDINKADISFNVGRSLVYHGIKMCKADLDFAYYEQMAVKKAATLLGVPDDIFLAIERLVDMEEAVHGIRKALLETDKL